MVENPKPDPDKERPMFIYLPIEWNPLNESYGYLWWLNGKNSHMQPRIQFTFTGSLNSNEHLEMISAFGKNGQIINIVPHIFNIHFT